MEVLDPVVVVCRPHEVTETAVAVVLVAVEEVTATVGAAPEIANVVPLMVMGSQAVYVGLIQEASDQALLDMASSSASKYPVS